MQIDDTRVVPLTLLAQAGFGLGLAVVVWWAAGAVAGYSVALGVATAVIPNAFLAARLLGPGAGGNARRLMRAAWIGEIGKLLLTIGLFATIFALLRPLAPLGVFGGFIAAQVAVFGAALGGSRQRLDEVTGKS